jgi:MerR family transcriptional regulator, copper efflux regulator
MDGLTIGEVAAQAKVHVETLRHYERRGLVARPPRSVSNYRRYPQDAVRRVQFIKRAQELGFSLTDIRGLLALRASPEAECGEIRAHAEAKIKAIDAKIDSLMAMKSALSSLVAACSGQGPVTECPILESLDTEEAIL